MLARPFYLGLQSNTIKELMSWSIDPTLYLVTTKIENATHLILPYSINHYIKLGMQDALKRYNTWCEKHNIHGYGFISGDWGRMYPEFENITYFRTSGFRSQLSKRNQGFPVALSDHHLKIYKSEEVLIRKKQEIPVIGFCGHATTSVLKRVKENLKFIIENIYRFIQNPFRKDWEPLFASAYERACLLMQLEQSKSIRTNFIYREHYRAGATSDSELERTTLEYYNNIRESDYVLCVRGGGNFSVRLFETLMMGRIPVFVNTDCLLPFPDQINWKQHTVWIEWKDRHQLQKKIMDFHSRLTDQEFVDLQKSNRRLWKETLSVSGLLKMINSSN